MTKDYLIRATAADGQIRAFACTSRNTVEAARAAHNTSPVATAALGRLMSAALMMAADMKGEKDLLTLRIECSGPIRSLTVTADAHGHVKGYCAEPNVILHANAQGKLDVAAALDLGVLSVIKDIGMKEPYVGQTELISGEIAEDLTYYYATSEQTPSSVALGVLMNRENTVRQAGGFIIQLMPGASEEIIAALEEKLASVKSVTSMLDAGLTPEDILEYLLKDFGLEINDTSEISFYCDCNQTRVEKALISIGKQELQEMIEEGKTIEVNCDFCGKQYHFTVEELQALYEQAK